MNLKQIYIANPKEEHILLYKNTNLKKIHKDFLSQSDNKIEYE